MVEKQKVFETKPKVFKQRPGESDWFDQQVKESHQARIPHPNETKQ